MSLAARTSICRAHDGPYSQTRAVMPMYRTAQLHSEPEIWLNSRRLRFLWTISPSRCSKARRRDAPVVGSALVGYLNYMISTRKPNADSGPDLPHDDEPPFDLPQAPSSPISQAELADEGRIDRPFRRAPLQHPGAPRLTSKASIRSSAKRSRRLKVRCSSWLVRAPARRGC